MNDPLLRNGREHGFFQFLRLLRLRFPSEQTFFDNVRIRAHLSLGFPQRDMERTHRSDDGRYRIDANFFGLYGVTSPLPTFYTEDLIDEQLQGTSAGRDFLDILHAALYPLQFRAWQKHRIWSAISERPGGKSLHYLHALLGLAGAGSTVRAQSIDLLRYAGLFNQYPRSALGLQQLLRAVLDDKSVEVVPCVEMPVAIDEPARTYLGVQCGVLGEDSVIGVEVVDRRGALEIRVGPLCAERFHQLLPGQALFKKLQQTVFLYLQASLRVRLVICVNAVERQIVVLGAHRHRLGRNTWLGGTHVKDEVSFMLSTENRSLSGTGARS
ncbi:type VI secretion protein [Pseudomonas plecoglossicida]|nr:hypothetical protein L321_18327 [Pseudomonas plecoglossicida NB2011]GLR37883.1 type VI secretion protein [Pseudomonas plecoglossicida]